MEETCDYGTTMKLIGGTNRGEKEIITYTCDNCKAVSLFCCGERMKAVGSLGIDKAFGSTIYLFQCNNCKLIESDCYTN